MPSRIPQTGGALARSAVPFAGTPRKDMRTTHTLIAWLAAAALSACTGPAETVSVHGTDLVVDRWSIERGGPGSSEPDIHFKACLKELAVVDGLSCEGWIRFHTEDRLAQCFLAEDALVQGHAFPAGTCLWFHPDGWLEDVWLSRDTVFDGVLYDGGWGKIMVSFHPNGRVRSGFLTEDTVLEGVPCLASLFHPVEHDAEGHLSRCTLAAPFEHGGRTYGRGDMLLLGR